MHRPLLRAALLLTCATIGISHAQSYPSKPVRLLVPFAAGGGADTLARVIGQKVSESLGQQFIVDNRPGGNTVVATEMLVRSPADGYTILIQTNNLTVNPTLYPKLTYDTLRDLAPVSLIAHIPHVLVIHPAIPARDLKAFVALAKSKPGAITYGTAGSGTVNHVTAALLEQMAGIRMTHVPYKGSGPIMPDLIGGHLESHFGILPVVRQHIASGKIRALAVTTAKRAPLIPDAPSFEELGYRGYDMSSWLGILAPAGTPNDIVTRLNAEIVRAGRRPDVQERLPECNYVLGTPAGFSEFLRGDVATQSRIVKAANITLD
jgi:tripartite-type tricarboxylate transporter receptor subunit TctC